MASFFGWLRENSEHYLMVGAHEQLARRYPGTRGPRRPHGPVEIAWLRVGCELTDAAVLALREGSAAEREAFVVGDTAPT